MKTGFTIMPALFEDLDRLGIARHVQRADIGAEGIAEIDQRRLVQHLGAGHGLAGLVHQREVARRYRPAIGDRRAAALGKVAAARGRP